MFVRVVMILMLGFSYAVYAHDTPLPPLIAQSLREHDLPENSLSVVVQELGSDETTLSFNADQLRQPASVIKTLTTYVALDVLGPAYTWKTRAFVDGALKNGVLNGDLIIVGGGDPYMTAERWWRFVTAIRQQGIKTITGDLVIDRSYFAPMDEDRSLFDGAPEKALQRSTRCFAGEFPDIAIHTDW